MNGAPMDIRALLCTGLSPVDERLYRAILAELVRGMDNLRADSNRSKALTGGADVQLAQYLWRNVDERLERIAALQVAYEQFLQAHTHAATWEEAQRHVLSFAERLGASRRQLRGDRAAFARWFGAEAIVERYQRLVAETARDTAFVLDRLGVVTAHLMRTAASGAALTGVWSQLDLEQQLQPLLTYSGDSQIRQAAFRCLATALRGIGDLTQIMLSDNTARYIFRLALDGSQDVWLQRDALRLLAAALPHNLPRVLHERLCEPGSGDDLFVRREALRLLADALPAAADLYAVLDQVAEDSSPAVRQLLVPALRTADALRRGRLLRKLIREDAVAQVRGAALLALLPWLDEPGRDVEVRAWLLEALQQETDKWVLRVALHVVGEGHAVLLAREYSEAAAGWRSTLADALTVLHQTAAATLVRRQAAFVRERLWVEGDTERRALAQALREWLTTISEGQRVALPAQWMTTDAEMLGRLLAWLAQSDFGLDVEHGRRVHLHRGDRFGFRSWRLLHELRHPSTDKRQAHSHTIGRVYRGQWQIASPLLAELAQTKVPGEPLYMQDENSWRPYLPLVDQMISALDLSRAQGALQVFSSEGVTEVEPPHSLYQRLRARLGLINRFTHYARLRNWQEGSRQSPDSYLKALEELGFRVRFRAHGGDADARVQRFFPAAFPLLEQDWGTQLRDYFFSVYENSLQELLIFLGIVGSWFVGRHLLSAWLVRRARRALPLVIGGWGTRGKSGTERLKAALFNALGHNVVSKTTGCEAMFLHAHANGTLREMFLFRSYDKATIWEQVNVLRLSTALKTDVFLWECMGLTPSYIEVLQQQWMKDDYSTITNTYPDHEDLQGPAGIDIPRVMTRFIPRRGRLITSEEQMLPILREAAREKGTPLRAVGWLQAGLLAPDLLARFPYEEHPYNIALVLGLADELGIESDFAIKAMADRVVADLGVLKVSPPARVRGRTLEFVNGMSANERFGCMANWERTGFDRQDPYAEPGVWLTTVVNNRADRVARSRVFAAMLVEDLATDMHVLIGTNLDGLQNYVRESWVQYESSLTLWPGAAATPADIPLQILEQSARRFRIRYRVEHVERELATLLSNLGIEVTTDAVTAFVADTESLRKFDQLEAEQAARLADHINECRQRLTDYAAMEDRLRACTGGPDRAIDADFRAQMYAWFEAKLMIIEDSHANGEQIIERITARTPPGMYNRVMGVQNIKGTGLDFVYRWQAWEKCHALCQRLRAGEDDAPVTLRELGGFQDYGQLSAAFVRETLDVAGHALVAQNEYFRAEMKIVEANLDKAMEKVQQQLRSSRQASWLSHLADRLEGFFDAGDAVRRRRHANRIYRDLATERIAHAQAALELQALNKRQKGGWLQRAIDRWMASLRT